MDQVQPETSQDPFDALEEALKRDIDQLIDQNCLSEGFTFGGHSFVIKTLLPNESNAAALAMMQFQGSAREVQAFMQAMMGLAIYSLDGDTGFHRRIGDLKSHALSRMDWIGNHLDDVILAYVFNRYNKLDERRIRARQAVENLPQPGQSASTPWPDSLIGQDTFSDGAPLGTPFSQK